MVSLCVPENSYAVSVTGVEGHNPLGFVPGELLSSTPEGVNRVVIELRMKLGRGIMILSEGDQGFYFLSKPNKIFLSFEAIEGGEKLSGEALGSLARTIVDRFNYCC